MSFVATTNRELIPLPVYRQFHRPQSDFLWACVETMLFEQFKECSQYHCWSISGDNDGVDASATICVKREPLGICLTMPDSDLEYAVDARENDLSCWHDSFFSHQAAPKNIPNISNIITSNAPLKKWAEHLHWSQFFALLTPAWFPGLFLWTRKTRLFLGSVVAPKTSLPLAYIPIHAAAILLKEWTIGRPPKSSPGHVYAPENDFIWQRFTFPPGSFKAADVKTTPLFMSSYVEFDNTHGGILDASWLAQANACIGPTVAEGKHGYGAINTLGCAIRFDDGFEGSHPDGIAQTVHLSIAPISVKHEGSRITFDHPRYDGLYWSLDSAGTNRLSPEECDSLGIPRLQFHVLKAANTWHEYHYAAIRDFFQAKGFDPYGYDVAKLLELPLVEPDSSARFTTTEVT
ncbi:hypothetical protein MSAN_02056000 [Mycena sanguinolenta]|uniref:Uncharacterized protein n=1 Tax=Mycena sanguinolenta TaxID=230812 RepID=A0A8H7CKZ4_9AGAR|nr:hypothetical protein MSAN_02056000 [Mycena sanguinolenta]